MTYKEQATADQWKALMNAPGAAAAFVSTASGGLIDMVKETFTASKYIQESVAKLGQTGYGALVEELLGAFKAMSFSEMQANAHPYQAKDPVGLRAEAKQLITDGFKAAAALKDSQGYKKWVLELARQVAETKSGGFLGIGGQSVIDEKEKAAIDELAAL
jgi:hypothetical protein